MRIYVESGGKKAADLRLPDGLVVNRFTALFAPAWMKKSGVTLTAAQAQRVVSALRRCRPAKSQLHLTKERKWVNL